jgi:hypothetical protein
MARDATAVAAEALRASSGVLFELARGYCPLHDIEGLRKANCHPFAIFFRNLLWINVREGKYTTDAETEAGAVQ